LKYSNRSKHINPFSPSDTLSETTPWIFWIHFSRKICFLSYW